MQTTEMIGSKITEARRKTGLSQAQLAEQLSVSPQAVGKWERGESMPDILTFDRLAGILGVDMNYFSANSQPRDDADEPRRPSQPGVGLGPDGGDDEPKPRWNMSSANWSDADFSGLKNLGDKFGNANISNCKFIGSELPGLKLRNNNVTGSDFSESDLSGSRFGTSNVTNSKFRNCALKDAQFKMSNIKDSDFTGADLTGTAFQFSTLTRSAFSGAALRRTTFRESSFADMTLEGTLEDCSFENCGFRNVTFQNATLLNTFFKGKSLKKIKFVDCRADSLTYAFLKNGKANVDGIALTEAGK